MVQGDKSKRDEVERGSKKTNVGADESIQHNDDSVNGRGEAKKFKNGLRSKISADETVFSEDYINQANSNDSRGLPSPTMLNTVNQRNLMDVEMKTPMVMKPSPLKTSLSSDGAWRTFSPPIVSQITPQHMPPLQDPNLFHTPAMLHQSPFVSNSTHSQGQNPVFGTPFFRSPATPFAVRMESQKGMPSVDHLMGSAAPPSFSILHRMKQYMEMEESSGDRPSSAFKEASGKEGDEHETKYQMVQDNPHLYMNTKRLDRRVSGEEYLVKQDQKKRKKERNSSDASVTKMASLKTGSSCHQCKSRQPKEALSYCMNAKTNLPQNSNRPCRKKYCDGCLQKFYNENPPDLKHDTNNHWPCPSCRSMCSCAACKKSREKKEP